MDVIFLDNRPFFPVSLLQGESESSKSEESNWVIFLESTSPFFTPLPNPDPHNMILPTNEVPWKTYYRRNLRKEPESPNTQLAPVQDSKPLRDQGMTDTTNSHIDSKMSESDRFGTIIPENIGEQDNVDTGVISNRAGSDGGNEVIEKVTKNKTKEDHLENISNYDSSLDLFLLH